MGEQVEAAVQLARLLGDDGLRGKPAENVKDAVSANLDRLAEALSAEAAASDDVYDRESALAYLEARFVFLSPYIGDAELARLREKTRDLVARW